MSVFKTKYMHYIIDDNVIKVDQLSLFKEIKPKYKWVKSLSRFSFINKLLFKPIINRNKCIYSINAIFNAIKNNTNKRK